MISRIIDWSVKYNRLVFTATLVACVFGWWSMQRLPLDAIPDLSDTQVILYSRWDRSPDVVEAQVTYPIVTAMLGAPQVKAVRGYSDFGYSFVYVIFNDGTDIYWARSRTMEYLASAIQKLPSGVKTEIGPDATGVGWVFQYALVDTTGQHSLEELRTYQDWYLRYYLKAVPGVAEVASLGGFGRQYQVNVNPTRLQAYGIPISRVVEAVRGGNSEVDGKVLDFGGTEYMVRGRGYATSAADFENIVVGDDTTGTPIRVRDIGKVVLGPEPRRGVADLDGTGEAVSGIVVMRQGENALRVIDTVKQKLEEIAPGLPPGVKLVPVYDRSELIHRAISNLKGTLVQILITVSVVILLFLWHIPSASIPLITIPVAVLLSFIPFRLLGMTANIMSLGGIAIAVGALVDASIVVVEQTHSSLEQWHCSDRRRDYREVIVGAIKQVGAPSFFALLVIAVSFLPVLTLEAQEGRLFKPLAYTKTLSVAIAAVLAITLDPALRVLFTRRTPFAFRPQWLCTVWNAVAVGKIHSEEKHPLSRVLVRIYEPVAKWSLRRSWLVIATAAVIVAASVPVFLNLGSEFMPQLDEGSLLYMPSTVPGISVTEAQKVLQVTDRVLKQFPEVDRVLGKAGRAESATDPAPLSMLETVIALKPKTEWRRVRTWYSPWAPEWLAAMFRHITPDRISSEALVSEMNRALNVPGLANAWTMPVRGRIDMLTTGIRTPVGLKISGSNVEVIDRLGTEVESLLGAVRGTRSVFSERNANGYFLDVNWDRRELAQHGVNLEDAQAALQTAVGGENVTLTVEGRERYPVSVRYMQDYRTDLPAIGRVLVSTKTGTQQYPLSELATVRASRGPAMVRDENGLLTGYVYVDITGRDANGYVAEADRLLRTKLKLPVGYSISWSGQYEGIQRTRQRLAIAVPLTLALILILLYANTRSLPKTLIVILAVPFSAVGAIWFVYMLGYNVSIAVWVGMIALLGVDAETGVFMLLYLDLAYEQAKSEGRMSTLSDLQDAILHGAVRRLRPKFMTVATAFLGLIPVMWATGTGSDVMKHIAAPMIGGIFTSFLLELLVYPSVYQIWRWNFHVKPSSAD